MAETLSAVSVLLVFLTVLLSSIEQNVETILSKRPQQEHKDKMRKYKRKIKNILCFKLIPISLIYTIVFYTLLPSTIEIISVSTFSFWHFDTLNTIFVFVEVGLLGLVIYSISKVITLFQELYK
ncbi:hypothetical protein [Culturomica massiliensis]|jgi:uncharacterized membrane protein YdbT with pleckstrin-like domain|uniref:hypothetical protein n=1 Tax=Culturomica massiliensis TaxID=1841857 RepID=UPI0011C4143D|nr:MULTISPECIES: hypothetical protein [Odoribacteraceae]